MGTFSEDFKIKKVLPEDNEQADIKSVLAQNKKIITFVGARCNGTSFIVNNTAELISASGIDVAVIDATKNKNDYYIFTKNEEKLRLIAEKSIKELKNGFTGGIKINEHLTVYTAIPGENPENEQIEQILETLVKKYSLVLIDCDFDTPLKYFEYSEQIYLIQSMNVLAIQPLTEFIYKMKNESKLDESKLKIVLNKSLKLDSITEKEIIGGIAFYNDPTASYMQQLFNKENIKFIKVPFDQDAYREYLDSIARCELNVKTFPIKFIQNLKELCEYIYPFVRY